MTIPRLTARLQAWVVKQRFAGLVADLLERQQRLSGALALLVTSEPLHTALGLLLALGNKLNAGTARGNAPAIRVESLSQLGSSSRSSASSVVGFLVRHVQRVSPELLGQIQTATQVRDLRIRTFSTVDTVLERTSAMSHVCADPDRSRW